jgi:hypothetical protein
MLWNLWLMVDFPVSLLAGPLEQNMGGFPYPGLSDIVSTFIMSSFLRLYAAFNTMAWVQFTSV